MSGTAGRPHRGRRDNGLDATEFVALADVDPRIGEHLLDVLGIVGIAAFLAPSADLNPVVRSTSLPARPTDRLWVDRERLDEARGLLEAVQEDAVQNESAAGSSSTEESIQAAPQRPIEVDVDAEWEKIIAGYDATAAPERPRRTAVPESDAPGPRPDPTASAAPPADPTADPLPVRRPGAADQPLRPETDADAEAGASPAAEADTEAPPAERNRRASDRRETDGTGPDRSATDHVPDDRGDPKGPERREPFRPELLRADLARPTGRDRLTGTDAPPTDFDTDPDEGYEPPPPPPLPRLSLPVIGALLAIACGLVLLFRSGTLGLSEHVRLLLSLVGILGGAGALVWRLRDGWSDDDPDDGAVV
ncbi:hypothetical protein [Cryptosporangium phraense]|uniref:DUF308 domain-containing protein n=1 Tax=Cryptosporangium phraense TaxID=2593070 RepID=A0A545AVG1_9ACTN|nr:hypothetical protein [Cryptosporangium phraense]TQS44585.1 hypothetical protein FL583_14125 [Cryptosporangium phraense]